MRQTLNCDLTNRRKWSILRIEKVDCFCQLYCGKRRHNFKMAAYPKQKKEAQSMAVKHINQELFDETVSQPGKKVLVDFFATWCNPCKILAPILDELSETLPENCEIVKIDVDENPEAARKFHVMSIPTLVLFQEGQAVERVVGARPAEEIARLFH